MIYRIFSIAFLLLFSLTALAQNENVMHEVKSGETKYGISREYEISIERLEKFNPDIKDGLKVGMTLLIPPPKKEEKPASDTAVDSGFVEHEVKAGETLFSLSQTYGVSQQEIIFENPEIKDGLKVGQVIKIPVPDEKDKNSEEELAGDFFYHKVEPQETAWSISQRYKISLDSLYLLNSGAEDGLRIGEALKLPPNRGTQDQPREELATDEKDIAEEQSQEITAAADTAGGYLLYKVKSGDSFYSLKERFEVSRDELIALNPEVSKGLEVDKYIIIPQKKEKKDVTFFDKLFKKVEEGAPGGRPSEGQISRKDSLNLGRGENNEVPAIDEDTLDVDISKNYRVALMLPFHAVTDTGFSYGERVERRSTYALDFYNGFLMAADSLAKEGMNVTLNVIDTENSLSKTRETIPELKRAQYNLVVGPLYKKNVELVARELEKEDIPVISPLSSTVDIEGQPNLIQCVPGTRANAEHIAGLLNNNYPGAKVIFVNYVRNDGNNQQSAITQIKARLQPRKKHALVETINIMQEETSYEDLREAVVDSGKNAIVVLSDDKVFLSGLVGNLRRVQNENTQIYLVGSPKLLDIPTLDLGYLNRFSLTMPDMTFVNYGDKSTVEFIADYRERFEGEPSRYAFQGYDVGMYFLRKLWKTGPFFMQAIQDNQPMLSTGFDMRKTRNGGYENTFLYLTRIKNLELVKLDVQRAADDRAEVMDDSRE